MPTVITNYNGIEPNKAQAKALKQLLYHVCHSETSGGGHPIVYTATLRDQGPKGFWVQIKSDLPSLDERDFLRVHYQLDSWFVFVGKRGGLEVHMAPKSMKQFKGQYWCGLRVRSDCSF